MHARRKGTAETLHRWRQFARCKLVVAVCVLSLHGRSGSAQSSLSQLHHTSWTIREGAPSSITALAQTSDGRLQLGSTAGLYSFNGYEFTLFRQVEGPDLPSLWVTALQADDQGGLWVGFARGGIAYIRNGRTTVYGPSQGVHRGDISQIILGGAGEVWAIAGNELIKFSKGHWKSFGPSEGETTNDQHGVDRIVYDSLGTLWVKFGETLYKVPQGQSTLMRTPEHSYYMTALRESSEHQLWLADIRSGVRSVCLVKVCPSIETFAIREPQDMMFDHDGFLWVSTSTGLFRLNTRQQHVSGASRSQQVDFRLDRFTSAQGLTSDRAQVVLVDREDNVWVGTRGGLDRFQQAQFSPILGLPEGPKSITASSNGITWLLNRDIGLCHMRDGKLQPAEGWKRPPWTPHDGRHSFLLARGIDNSILVSDDTGLYRYQLSRRIRIKRLPILDGFPILAMSEDKVNGIVLSIARKGVWRLRSGNWAPFDEGPPSSKNNPGAVALDSRNRLWLGYPDGTVSVRDGGVAHVVQQADQQSLGDIAVFTESDGSMWVGGSNGLAVIDSKTLNALQLRSSPTLRGISGLLQAADGGIWVNSAVGIARFSPGEITKVLSQPDYTPQFEIFDYRNGIAGVATQFDGRPSAIEDHEGKLWFGTTGGVYSIDPRHIRRNVLAPITRITDVIIDGKRIHSEGKLLLSSPSHTVEIRYEGISLTLPERVQYRYRLTGVDNKWQSADNRREAIYTDLRPGNYNFEVVASNADGIWNTIGPQLGIEIEPSFYQTTWFRSLCAAVSLAALWLVYRLRLRVILNRIQERLDERGQERLRIARDLHDTLLQGVQGLILRFHFAAELVPEQEPARAMLHDALSRADKVIAEGRDCVKQLRGDVCSSTGLINSLHEVAKSINWNAAAEVRVLAAGDTRILQSLVYDELLYIGREAISNALRHGGPTLVEVELNSGPKELILLCRDNGKGMTRTRISESQHNEHWGITGMRERAARIGARFELWSTPGAGTEIEVRLSGLTAYHNPGRNARWDFLGRLSPRID